MSKVTPDSTFDRFARRCAKDFGRIARATRGELEPDDVRAEAWLLADATDRNAPGGFDLDAPGADRFLLSRLFQKLVRYTELNVRHAVRLDHGKAGGDEGDVHPLMHLLVSDDGRGPLDTLERRESAIDEEAVLDGSGSLAVAYVRLLRRFDNHMQTVANHLLISKSWAYRRCARARVLAVCQVPMTTPMMTRDFRPGPWRPFQIWRPRIVQQVAFDFDGLML